jgi:phage-related protein
LASGLIQAIPDLLNAAWRIVTSLVDRFKSLLGIRSPSTLFSGFGRDLIQGLINGIGNMVNGIRNAIGNVTSRISEGITNTIGKARSWGSNMISNLSDGISNMRSRVTNAVSGIGSSISGSVSGVIRSARSWGSDMMDGLSSGISNAREKVANAARSVASRIKNFIHFTRPDEGPLRDYEQWMPHMIDGMTEGINRNMGRVVGATRRLSQEMSEAMTPTVELGMAADMQGDFPLAAVRAVRPTGAYGGAGGYNDPDAVSEAVKRGVSEGMKAAGQQEKETVVNVYEDGVLKRTIREGKRANQRAGKPVLQMG